MILFKKKKPTAAEKIGSALLGGLALIGEAHTASKKQRIIRLLEAEGFRETFDSDYSERRYSDGCITITIES